MVDKVQNAVRRTHEFNQEKIQKNKFDSVTDELTETFNLNSGWLVLLYKYIDLYNDLQIMILTENQPINQRYYEQQIRILRILFNLLRCKMKSDIEEKLNNKLIDIKNKSIDMFEQTNKGTYVNGEKLEQVNEELDNYFGELMKFMENKGILTFQSDDPNIAMSKFSD